MKRLLMLLLLLLGVQTGQAQQLYRPLSEFGTDTLAYIDYNFDQNKERYIGKTVAEFLREWGMPIGDFTAADTGIHNPDREKREKIQGIHLYYLTGRQIRSKEDNKLPYYTVALSFLPPHTVSSETYRLMSIAKDSNRWDKDYYNFFKDFVIDNIYIIRHKP